MMKVPVALTFLLVAISQANSLHSFDTYRTTPAIKGGMVPDWNFITNFFNLVAEAMKGLLSLKNNKECLIINALYTNRKLKNPDLPKISSAREVNMLDSCSTRDIKASDLINRLFIYPGTKWCGKDNIAKDFHDLGNLTVTDSCCREHDYCDDVIYPGRTVHNLFNPYMTPRFHCKCDEAFRHCLKKDNTFASSVIGNIFFDLIQGQCFDFESPARCLAWDRGAFRLYCIEYEFRDDQPKKWQWFDKDLYL